MSRSDAGSDPQKAEAKSRSSRNSYKHGFTAKFLVFKNREEESAYRQIEKQLIAEFMPVGLAETAEVLRLAASYWKEQMCEQLIQKQVQHYSISSLDTELSTFVKGSPLPQLCIPGISGNGPDAAPGLEIREIVATVGSDMDEHERSQDRCGFGDSEGNVEARSNQERTRYHVDIRLGQALTTLLRYAATIQKDKDRSLARLAKLRELRSTRVGLASDSQS